MHLPTDTRPGEERIRWVGSVFHDRLASFLSSLLWVLDARVDRRLVHTFSLLVAAIIRFRHRHHGLLLSELGAYVLSPDRAPAGTKRISTLLRSNKWHYSLLSNWLRIQAKEQLRQWPTQPVLLHWDESVVEKPESIHTEGLCPVKKPGQTAGAHPARLFNPPLQRPVHVPGFHWLGLLLMGLHTKPCLYLQEWWSTRLGPGRAEAATIRRRCLRQAVNDFGRRVIHVFDRGYARRWQIEAAFRYSKSELALESPRLWFWENRLKLMMVLSVVYAFLLSLLELEELRQLLRWGCHRTGKRYQATLIPLYRVRTALMHVWNKAQSLNSG